MDRLKIRFSSKRFTEVIDSLSEDQKAFVVKNGFHNLLAVRKFSVPLPLLEWVMGQVVVDHCEFKHRTKSFKLTKFMVHQMLGIPSGDIPIVLHNPAPKIRDQVAQHTSLFRHGAKLSIAEAVAKLLDDHVEDSFMMMFMLVALSTIICPSTQNFVNMSYLPFICDVDGIKQYDWYSHILNYMLSEVKKYQGFISSKDEGKIYVGSCLPLIVVSFWFHTLQS